MLKFISKRAKPNLEHDELDENSTLKQLRLKL